MFHQNQAGREEKEEKEEQEEEEGVVGLGGCQRAKAHQQWEPFDGSGVNVLTI